MEKLREITSALKKHRSKEEERLKQYRTTAVSLIGGKRVRGWRRLRDCGGRLFINKNLGLVVKRNYLTTDRKPAVAVPTVMVGDILIQPLIDVNSESTQLAERVLSAFKCAVDRDLKQANVGLYKGIPVMHDW